MFSVLYSQRIHAHPAETGEARQVSHKRLVQAVVCAESFGWTGRTHKPRVTGSIRVTTTNKFLDLSAARHCWPTVTVPVTVPANSAEGCSTVTGFSVSTSAVWFSSPLARQVPCWGHVLPFIAPSQMNPAAFAACATTSNAANSAAFLPCVRTNG